MIAFCVGSYFIGNINFAIIFSRTRKKDIRNVGSGNAGTTNMLRAFGFRIALLTLVLDGLKGAVPALIAYFSFGMGTAEGMLALYACGFATVLGHCYPVLYRFRGGKGVATIVGVFFVANPLVAFIAFMVGIIYVLIWEYSAISSLIFVTTMVIYQSLQYNYYLSVNLILFAFYLLVWITHRKNIFRLLTGEESRASILKKLKRKTMIKKQQDW